MSQEAIQNETNNEYVGARVAKYFGSEIFLGTVNAIKEELYHILYDDGDKEDMGHNDLLEAIRLNKLRSVNNGSRVVIKYGNKLCEATVSDFHPKDISGCP